MSLQPPEANLGGFGLNPWLDQQRISDEQWVSYFRNGYLHLGPIADPDGVERLKERVDDLALGRVTNPDVRLQLDTGGRYEDLLDAVAVTGQNTLVYRKVQGLETDDLFRAVLTHPIFAEVAAHHYGRHTSTTLFRAMVMNKPASQGTQLPWHQDGGDVWALDRDPLITIWMALDDATAANGCVEVLPGSHRLGLLSQQGSTISDEEARLPRGCGGGDGGSSRPRDPDAQLAAAPIRNQPDRWAPACLHRQLLGLTHPQHPDR